MSKQQNFTVITIGKNGARRLHWGKAHVKSDTGQLTFEVPSPKGASKTWNNKFEFSKGNAELVGNALLKWDGKPLNWSFTAHGKKKQVTINQLYTSEGRLVLVGMVDGIGFITQADTGSEAEVPEPMAMGAGAVVAVVAIAIAIVAISAAAIAVAGAVAVVAAASAMSGGVDVDINVNGDGEEDGGDDGDGDGGGDGGGGDGGDGD